MESCAIIGYRINLFNFIHMHQIIAGIMSRVFTKG